MPHQETWKTTLRTALAIGLFFVLTCGILAFLILAIPQKPKNLPATPLTSQQLAQRPLLVHPQATFIHVRRDSRRFGPDERRPDRPRFGERITTYWVVATPEEIEEFFRATLIAKGWQRCGKTYIGYRRDGASCDGMSTEEIIVSIVVAAGTVQHPVKVIEILPPPLEWPEP